MKKITFLLFAVLYVSLLSAQYSTPGDGNTYTLSDLSSISGGVVSPGFEISADLTISYPDTLLIVTDEVVTVAEAVLITVEGTFISTPPTEVLFTTGEDGVYFLGFDFDAEQHDDNLSGSLIENTTIERSGGISVVYDKDILFKNSTFRFNNFENASGVIDCFHANPVIYGCYIHDNAYPAVASGATAASSPSILYSTIENNVTANVNRPQVNLGTNDPETPILIYGNQIIGGGYDQSGAISVATLAGGGITAVISNNLISENRYGINVFGNSIFTLIMNNTISDNDHEDDPMSGGSGITYWGDGTNQSFVYENRITGNLWGVTIVNAPSVSLGESTLASPGMNAIFGNGNGGVPYELYNNTANGMAALGNYWGGDESVAAAGIFDASDDPALGEVFYLPIYATEPSVETNLFAFSLLKDGETYEGVIDQELLQVSVNVPIGTDLSELTAEFSTATDSHVEVFGLEQEEGVTTNDFSEPVYFTVMPQSGVGANYKVIVTESDAAVESYSQLAISIYPNPATNYVKLSQTADVVLYDLSGRMVGNYTAVNSMDVTNLNSGMYFFEISVDGAKARRSVVIEK